MRNIWFVLFFLCLPGILFSQVRDLFAEFEEEEALIISSSSLAASSSSGDVALTEELSSSSVFSSSSEVSPEPLSSSSASTPPVPAGSDSLLSFATESSSDTSAFSSSEIPADTSSSASVSDTVPASLEISSSSAIIFTESSSSYQDISSSSVSRKELLGPVKVSRVFGIDEMKGRYKSPKKALFMSLVVPGSGQLYVGGTNFNYVRGGVYLALEAGLWSGWYYYSVYKYDRQVSRYRKFAKQNFSAGWYEQKMRNLYNELDDSDAENRFVERYLSDRESYCKAIYGTATSSNCYNKDAVFENDRNHKDRFDTVPLGNTLNGMSFSDANSYYQLIAGSNYVLGWMDVENEASIAQLGLNSSSSETVALGTSANQKKYKQMRSKANDYAGMQAWFFGGIILNHIVSAVDAAFTANAHNKLLYEEKLSWYDRLHFRSDFSVIEGVEASFQAFWSF